MRLFWPPLAIIKAADRAATCECQQFVLCSQFCSDPCCLETMPSKLLHAVRGAAEEIHEQVWCHIAPLRKSCLGCCASLDLVMLPVSL
eukprot:6316504-Amphidinium_carterae.1